MKAYLFDKFGIENLTLKEIGEPQAKGGYIRVKPILAGINPLDYNVAAGKVIYGVQPMPHIPGSEILAVVDQNSEKFRKGDRVLIYDRIYDGTCDFCLSGHEYLCNNGVIYGVGSNGGFAEALSIREENLFKVPDSIADEVAVSIPIAALTPYHALKEARVGSGQSLLVYGASGNTGIFATQLGNLMELEVYAISSKNYLKDFGASETFSMEKIPENFKADIVINSLGGELFSKSIDHVKKKGKLITFGVLSGRECTLDLGKIYTGELIIIGSTGGSRSDMREIINIASEKGLKVKIDKIFPFDKLKDALKYFEKPREGRVLIKF